LSVADFDNLVDVFILEVARGPSPPAEEPEDEPVVNIELLIAEDIFPFWEDVFFFFKQKLKKTDVSVTDLSPTTLQRYTRK